MTTASRALLASGALRFDFGEAYFGGTKMIGENAALIVQAENHISIAGYELKTAIDRCQQLRARVDCATADSLSDIIEDLKNKNPGT